MRRAIGALIVLASMGVVAVWLAETDNPVSRVFRKWEARRYGFVRPNVGSDSTRPDLEAFQAARERCVRETESQWNPEWNRCRRCMIEECLEAEGKRYADPPALGFSP